jgi:hypothetical protein
MSRKSSAFDDEGRKIYSTNSPGYVGTRKAGPPPANPPRWQASLMRSWGRIEMRSALKAAAGTDKPARAPEALLHAFKAAAPQPFKPATLADVLPVTIATAPKSDAAA